MLSLNVSFSWFFYFNIFDFQFSTSDILDFPKSTKLKMSTRWLNSPSFKLCYSWKFHFHDFRLQHFQFSRFSIFNSFNFQNKSWKCRPYRWIRHHQLYWSWWFHFHHFSKPVAENSIVFKNKNKNRQKVLIACLKREW